MNKFIPLILLAIFFSLPGSLFAEGIGTQSGTNEISTYRNCEHTHSYHLDIETYVEATGSTGGYRKYVCDECGAEYAYSTDPLVYDVNPQTGKAANHAGATNPYMPLWEHVPDGEPHVFWSRDDDEWRVYVYGSHDIKGGTGYCGLNYVTWSAPVYDLSDWRNEGIIYDGNNTGIMSLFAPDTDYDVYTDTYYITIPEVFTRVTLRRSDSPAGRFDAEGAGREGALFAFASSSIFDPVIYMENGEMYIMGSSSGPRTMPEGLGGSRPGGFGAQDDLEDLEPEVLADPVAAMPEEIKEAKEADGYNSGMGQTAIIYKMKDDPSEGVESISWCPTDENMFLPVYEGTSLRRDPDTGAYIMVYVATEYDTEGENPSEYSSTLAYAYTYDLMGTWYYGDNGLNGTDIVKGVDDGVTAGNRGNVISDTSGRYVRNAKTGKMEFIGVPTYPHDNNHGGMAKINGDWYIFGHRHSGVGKGGRQGVMEKLDVKYEGDKPIISPMELTSSGPAGSIDAYEVWNAGITCYLTPGVGESAPISGADTTTAYVVYDTLSTKTHAAPIENLRNNHVVGYKYLDFGNSHNVALNLLVSKEANYVNGVIKVFIDEPSVEMGGTLIGTANISEQAVEEADQREVATDGTVWKWVSSKMDKQLTGKHAVYFVMNSENEGVICKIDQFGFSTY